MQAPSRNAKLAGGKYELVHEIGRGGMGTVWRAHSVLLDRPCAIKFLKPEIAEQPLSRERFVHEARVAAGLRSPYIVTIYDVDHLNGVPFIAMELLPGESLERRLDRGPLSPQFTCQLIRQVAAGLSKAHEAGLVHRDLKPDNVFLVEDRPLMVKILDFGVAKSLSGNAAYRTATGAIIGTPYYMSPEQAMGQQIDARSDLWALGILTYRCLTGRLPFVGESWPQVLLSILQAEIPPLALTNIASPRAVDRWWRRVMQRDPASRPATAHEFADGLEEALLGAKSRPPEAGPASESAVRVRLSTLSAVRIPLRRTWIWALGGAALGAAALIAVLSLPEEGDLTPAVPERPTLIAPQQASLTDSKGISAPVHADAQRLPAPTPAPTPPAGALLGFGAREREQRAIAPGADGTPSPSPVPPSGDVKGIDQPAAEARNEPRSKPGDATTTEPEPRKPEPRRPQPRKPDPLEPERGVAADGRQTQTKTDRDASNIASKPTQPVSGKSEQPAVDPRIKANAAAPTPAPPARTEPSSATKPAASDIDHNLGF